MTLERTGVFGVVRSVPPKNAGPVAPDTGPTPMDAPVEKIHTKKSTSDQYATPTGPQPVRDPYESPDQYTV
jgi:hypothetical protein